MFFGFTAMMFHAGCSSLHKSDNSDVVHVKSTTHHLLPESQTAFRLGLKHYHSQRFDLAAKAFRKAIELDGANGRAHNNLGLIYFDQHRLASAASHFDSAAALLPDEPSPLNNLGLALEQGGRTDEALEYFELAAQMDPNNPLYVGNLVRARVRMGDESDHTYALLQQLVMIEHRPEWRRWARDKLNLDMNPLLDRGEVSKPTMSNAASEPALTAPQNGASWNSHDGEVSAVILDSAAVPMDSGHSVVVRNTESVEVLNQPSNSFDEPSNGEVFADPQDYFRGQ
ncbi:MAG: tetratricopeptide repeat protein [Pirellulaceae bacterium]